MATEADLLVTHSFTVRDGESGSLFADITPSVNKAVFNGRMGVSTLNPQNALDVAGSVAIGGYGGQNVSPPNSLIVSGNLGVGTPTPTAKHHILANAPSSSNSALVANATSAVGDASGLQATASIATSATAIGISTAANGAGGGTKIGLMSSADGPGYRVASAFTAYNPGTDGSDSYGVQATAYGGTSWGSAYGVYSQAYGDGTGYKNAVTGSAWGYEGSKIGGSFNASSYSTTNTLTTRGVYGYGYGAGPGVVIGVDGDAIGGSTASKYGVDASATHNGSAYGNAYGLYCSATNNTNGSAVGINNYASGSNNSYHYGIQSGVTSSGSGGAWCYGASISANNTGGSGGVYGLVCSALGASTGPKYALYSYASGGGTLYAGYFSGRVHISGTLSKSSGTFLIDHPLDPYNRLLRHNFVESPEELCVYRGKVKLDGAGQGAVTMPSYFAALTKEDEATVTVSPIGRKAFLTSYEWNAKFDGFTVFGEPNAQVSYIVLATRDDPSIRVLRQPVEEDKQGDEKGKLLLPDAYPDPKAPKRAVDEITDPVVLATTAHFKEEKALRERTLQQQRAHTEELVKTQDQRLKQVTDAKQAFDTREAKRAADLKASIPKPIPLPKTTK